MSTVNLNNADAIYFGDRPVDRVYLGTRQVWPWTPELLFQNGEQGGAWDFTTAQGLFQDAAGTVPVVAFGDPIGMAMDLSGNGNHLLQTTVPARPTYTEDGAFHDGVDDFLMAANAEDWTFLHDGTGGTLGFSGSWSGSGTQTMVGTQNPNNSTTIGANLGVRSSSLSSYNARLTNGSVVVTQDYGNGGWPESSIRSAMMSYTTPVVSLWGNGQKYPDLDASSVVPSTEPPFFPLRTNSRPSSSSSLHRRRLFVISRLLTESERAFVNAWLMEGVE